MNEQLDRWLQEVSRSFYLSLNILPSELREPLSIAYLWARKLDTIADTSSLPLAQRKEMFLLELLRLRQSLALGSGAAITDALVDDTTLDLRTRILVQVTGKLPSPVRQVLESLFGELPKAMLFDLDYFATQNSIQSIEQCKQYTDWAAGCVGVAWTELCQLLIKDCAQAWDFEAQKMRGRALGQFLQWVNILRDQHADKNLNRRYLPLVAADNLSILWSEHIEPLAHEGLAYIKNIPASQPSLTVSAALPLLLGLKTLEGLKGQKAFKLSRLSVLATLGQVEMDARFNRVSLFEKILKQIASTKI